MYLGTELRSQGTMSDKENERPSLQNAFKAALGNSFGKRKQRALRGVNSTQLAAHQSQNPVERSAVPQLAPRPLKHAIRPDTRPAGSRLRRKTAEHADCSIDVAHFADLGSMLYAPEPTEKPSEDTLWARGRNALFEQRLRSEPYRDDRIVHMELCRLEYCIQQSESVQFVRCERCTESTQAVVIISEAATVKVQIPFVACAGYDSHCTRLSAVQLAHRVHQHDVASQCML